jgi:hypothetical protein
MAHLDHPMDLHRQILETTFHKAKIIPRMDMVVMENTVTTTRVSMHFKKWETCPA